jgi:lysozyme
MRTSEEGKEFIKDYEGLRLKAYRCAAGVLTIGYGHTGGVKKGQEITEHQADVLLNYDLERFEDAVNAAVAQREFLRVTQREFDALVSFTFNVGIGDPDSNPPEPGLLTSTLLRKFLEGDRQGAADQFLRWNKVKGKVNKGLTRRREMERLVFLGERLDK